MYLLGNIETFQHKKGYKSILSHILGAFLNSGLSSFLNGDNLPNWTKGQKDLLQ